MRIPSRPVSTRSLSAAVIVVVAGTVLCQCALVSRLFGRHGLADEPAITTGISDAVTSIPFLDDFAPSGALSMGALARGEHGGFLLSSGLYELTAQSYCLHAGKYGPSAGAGYLYSPLKGPRAEVIRNILERSTYHPEIPQRNIQVLIWAILAKTKISDAPPTLQLTAATLLTPGELVTINGGALSLLPADLVERGLAQLPEPVREALQVEAKLRESLTRAQSTYEDLERLAVQFGEPPAQPGVAMVPSGRWSYHRDGYFIQFTPSSYSRTRIKLYRPEQFHIERDEQGRITRLSDATGNAVETSYDDSVTPQTVSGDAAVKAHAFGSVRLIRAAHPQSEIAWSETGWTLVGTPTGAGIAADSGRFVGVAARYDTAARSKSTILAIVGNVNGPSDGRSGPDDVMDLTHYALAIRSVIAGEGSEAPKQTAEHGDMVLKAWQYFVCREVGGCAAASASPTSGGWGGAPELTLSDVVAVPGETSRQRLAQSSRTAGDVPECDPRPVHPDLACPQGTTCRADMSAGAQPGYPAGYFCCPGDLKPCKGQCVADTPENFRACRDCGDVALTKCGDLCVNLNTDATNCGECGVACPGNQVCLRGRCACAAGWTDCGGICRDLQREERNCGECGNVCRGRAVCMVGSCVCPEGTERCAGECVDPTRFQQDDRHCGACGRPCDAKRTCRAGECVCRNECTGGKIRDGDTCECRCPSDKPHECNGKCVNKNVDSDNCGECDHKCGRRRMCFGGACKCDLESVPVDVVPDGDMCCPATKPIICHNVAPRDCKPGDEDCCPGGNCCVAKLPCP